MNIEFFDIWIGVLIILCLLYGYFSRKYNSKYFISNYFMAIWICIYGLFKPELDENLGYLYLIPLVIFIFPVVLIFIENKIKK